MPEKTVTAPLLPDLETLRDNKPRVPKPVDPPPEPEESKKEEEEAPAEIVEGPPTYADGLKANKLSVGQAREIMEKILVKGFYEEDYRIGGMLPIKLRTRNYTDSVRTQNYLESESPTYNLVINEVIARYNLSASLSQFGERIFSFPAEGREEIEEAFQERYNFVMAQPYVVINKLQGFLYLFDRRVAAVFAEGAPEDF